MPVYDFQSAKGKIISVLVTLDRPDEDRRVQIEDGEEYYRVYASPRAAIDTKMVEGSKDEFRKITAKKGISNKAMWELSAEMAARRVEKTGKDEVKQKFYRQFEKEHGVKHTGELREEKRRRAKLIAEQFGFET